MIFFEKLLLLIIFNINICEKVEPVMKIAQNQ
jgi:hypothetical protein